MKQIIIVLTFIVLTQTANCGWFDNSEKDRRIAAEQQLEATKYQLNAQSKATGSWQFAATILMVGCVLALVVGAAIGSRAKNHAKQPE